MTRAGLAALFAGGVLLAGCGSHRSSQPLQKPDSVYDDAMDTGKSVFDLGQISQAEGHYRDALKRAYLRDDALDIHDAGFNLATTLLDRDKARDALDVADATLSALRIRQFAGVADLALVRAAAFYRLGDDDATLRTALEAERGGGTDVRARAAWLEGLAGARSQREDVVRASIAQLGGAEFQVDRMELQARLALMQRDPTDALALARQVVARRRDVLDYRGMRRGLVLAAQAATAAGDGATAAAFATQAKESDAQKSAANGQASKSTPAR